MSKISAEETILTILEVEERLARLNYLFISNLKPESALLKSKASLIDALKPFGVESESQFEFLSIVKEHNSVLIRTHKKDSALLSKMKFFLEELFLTSDDERIRLGKVAWISDEEASKILDKFGKL